MLTNQISNESTLIKLSFRNTAAMVILRCLHSTHSKMFNGNLSIAFAFNYNDPCREQTLLVSLEGKKRALKMSAMIQSTLVRAQKVGKINRDKGRLHAK